MYYSALKYVIISERQVLFHQNHPDLQEVAKLKTKKYKRAYRRICDRKRKQNNQSSKIKKIKKLKLSNLDVSEVLMTNNIQNKNVFKSM